MQLRFGAKAPLSHSLSHTHMHICAFAHTCTHTRMRAPTHQHIQTHMHEQDASVQILLIKSHEAVRKVHVGAMMIIHSFAIVSSIQMQS